MKKKFWAVFAVYEDTIRVSSGVISIECITESVLKSDISVTTGFSKELQRLKIYYILIVMVIYVLF